MKTLVVYDSVNGNTGEIAEAIGTSIGSETKVLKVNEVTSADMEGIGVFIAGSPTYGGRPTQSMQTFLKTLPGNALSNVQIACFDTRFPSTWVKIFGFAAGKIEKSLAKVGGKSAIKPEGFFVTGTKGPLVENETQRAGEWAKSIIAGIS